MYKKKLRLVSAVSLLLSCAALMFLATLTITWFNFQQISAKNDTASSEMVAMNQLYNAHTELRRTRLSLERANAANLLGATDMRDQAIRMAFMSDSKSEQFLQRFLARNIEGVDNAALREAFDSYHNEVIDPTFQTIQNNDARAHDVIIVNGASYDRLLAWQLENSAEVIRQRVSDAQQALTAQQQLSARIIGACMAILFLLSVALLFVLRHNARTTGGWTGQVVPMTPTAPHISAPDMPQHTAA